MKLARKFKTKFLNDNSIQKLIEQQNSKKHKHPGSTNKGINKLTAAAPLRFGIDYANFLIFEKGYTDTAVIFRYFTFVLANDIFYQSRQNISNRKNFILSRNSLNILGNFENFSLPYFKDFRQST